MIRIWKYLREPKTSETNTEKILRQKYNQFLAILSENGHALDLMTVLEDKLFNDQLISIPYLKNMMRNLSKSISAVMENLIALADGNYAELRTIFNEIESNIREILTGRKKPLYTPTIISMDHIRIEYIDKVGGKVANLGELGNCCGLLVPDGFGVTVCAFTHFSEYNNLQPKIDEILWRLDPEDSRQLITAEKALKKLFLESQVPPEIANDIARESKKVSMRHHGTVYWAVRSSAIGEDMKQTFAGQFSTILNVRTDQLLQKYKEVAASKYNFRAIVYQRMKNIRDDDINMSVGFMTMVDPICSGVLYTTNPVKPKNQEMVINAVWGLGELLVDGTVSGDVYILGREPGFSLKKQEIADKKVFLKRSKGGGLQRLPTDPEKSGLPCLDKSQLQELAEMALKIESHFKSPQDIEWCIDHQNRLFVLQSRPLNVFEKTETPHSTFFANVPIIARDAQPVSPGIGSGKVFKAADIHDIVNFPKDAVLVIRNSSPRFIGALAKASAVIVERGNWTDHMASVIREFKVPCLIRVPAIFSTLDQNQWVTVDAATGIIYQGMIPNLQEKKTILKENVIDIKMTESHRLLKKISSFIFHLNLTDPRQENFRHDRCKTLHDIVRFCHETALNEMFLLKEKSHLDTAKHIYRVHTKLPLQLYVLDILGTSVINRQKKTITPEDVQAPPFMALWKGMSDPGINWSGPEQQMGIGDLFSAMIRTPMTGSQSPDMRSYAVVTPNYLNLSLSMGYHYVILDCYVCPEAYNNYISLSFKGGAAEARKRNLRVAFIASILKHIGFTVTTTNDFLKARIKAETEQELSWKITIIGRMLGETRLLDMAMTDKKMVDRLVIKFLERVLPGKHLSHG